MPNTEVKPSSADGTACESEWESRSLPGTWNKALPLEGRALFFNLIRWGIPFAVLPVLQCCSYAVRAMYILSMASYIVVYNSSGD